MHTFVASPILRPFNNSVNGVYLKKLLFVLVVGFWSSYASAATTDAFRFGLMPTISNYTVVDPSGPTAQGSGFSFLSGIVIADAGRDGRFLGHIISDKFSISPSVTNIGQDVTRVGGSVSYQSMLRVTRGWKPWVGIGLGQSSETYKNRFKLSTQGGFSQPLTPSQLSVNNTSILVNTSTEWQFNKQWDMGMHLQYEQPIGDGSKVFRVGIYAVF